MSATAIALGKLAIGLAVNAGRAMNRRIREQRQRRERMEDTHELMDRQEEHNREMFGLQTQESQRRWEQDQKAHVQGLREDPSHKIAGLRKAGLSIGLMMAGGAGGGMGASGGAGRAGGGAGGGVEAMDAGEEDPIGLMLLPGQLRQQRADRDRTDAETELIRAQTATEEVTRDYTEARTETEEVMRGVIADNMQQDTIRQVIENMRMQWENSVGKDARDQVHSLRHANLNKYFTITSNSIWNRRNTEEVIGLFRDNDIRLAERERIAIEILDTDARMRGYMRELLIAQTLADNAREQTAISRILAGIEGRRVELDARRVNLAEKEFWSGLGVDIIGSVIPGFR